MVGEGHSSAALSTQRLSDAFSSSVSVEFNLVRRRRGAFRGVLRGECARDGLTWLRLAPGPIGPATPKVALRLEDPAPCPIGKEASSINRL